MVCVVRLISSESDPDERPRAVYFPRPVEDGRRHEKSGDRSAAELERPHRKELPDSNLRQIGHIQPCGTGSLRFQRDRGERSSRELQNILRFRVNDNGETQRFRIWPIEE